MGKRAVYPGMFDPVHNGHVDVIQRSLQIFDELIVAVVANPSKEPLFPVSARLQMIDEATAEFSNNFRIVAFDGLLIDLVEREDGDAVGEIDALAHPGGAEQQVALRRARETGAELGLGRQRSVDEQLHGAGGGVVRVGDVHPLAQCERGADGTERALLTARKDRGADRAECAGARGVARGAVLGA